MIAVADSQQPTRSATGTLTINVPSNTNCPTFSPPYRVTIPETHAVGTTVIRVNATDNDGDLLTYRIANPSDVIRDLFMIDYRTGEIISKGNLAVSALHYLLTSIRPPSSTFLAPILT